MARALVGLGSNVGDRAGHLLAARRDFAALAGVRLCACSLASEWPAAGGPSGQAAYLNAAYVLETSLAPRELLARMQEIEQQQGRRRETRWGARTLDLDLLLYDEQVCRDASLCLPHPRMAVRAFVLEPAAEVAGDWLHGSSGWRVSRLWRHLQMAPAWIALGGPADWTERITQGVQAHLPGVLAYVADDATAIGQMRARGLECREFVGTVRQLWLEKLGTSPPSAGHDRAAARCAEGGPLFCCAPPAWCADGQALGPWLELPLEVPLAVEELVAAIGASGR